MLKARPHASSRRDALASRLATANDLDAIVAECADRYVMARGYGIGRAEPEFELLRVALNAWRRRRRAA